MKTHLNPQAEAVAKALGPDEIADIDRAIRAMSIEQRLRIARVFHNRCLVRQGGMQLPPPRGNAARRRHGMRDRRAHPGAAGLRAGDRRGDHGSLGVEEEMVKNG